jgi:hypothetical protein
MDVSGHVTVSPAPSAYASHYWKLIHDVKGSMDYALVLDGEGYNLLRLDGDGTVFTTVLPRPDSHSLWAARYSDDILYALFIGNRSSVITRTQIRHYDPSLKGELRIMTQHHENRDRDNFISYFRARYPYIEVSLITPPSNHAAAQLQLLSGEMDVDIIFTEPSLFQTGIYRDLMEFPAITKALENPNLLEGVRQSLTDPAGFVFGVPISAGYAGFLINEELFQKWDIEVPSFDWIVSDYYNLAMKVVDLNQNRNAEIFLTSRHKDDFAKTSNMMYQPEFMAFASNNRDFIPRFDTPEMVDFFIRAKDVYELFNYIYFEAAHTPVANDNHLLHRVSMIPCASDPPLRGLWAQASAIPLPRDIYGNRRGAFGEHWGVYTHAKNKVEAELFLSEYLDEEYHRNSIRYIQLFNDISKYDQIDNIPQSHRDVIYELTKVDTFNSFTVGITLYEVTVLYFELDAKFMNDEITAQQFAQMLQTETEKRRLG